MNLLEAAVQIDTADKPNSIENMRAGCTYTLNDIRNVVKGSGFVRRQASGVGRQGSLRLDRLSSF
jgi:hypothetical protein